MSKEMRPFVKVVKKNPLLEKFKAKRKRKIAQTSTRRHSAYQTVRISK